MTPSHEAGEMLNNFVFQEGRQGRLPHLMVVEKTVGDVYPPSKQALWVD